MRDSSRSLRNYYEKNDVEFLGWSDASSKLFYGVGVRRTTGVVLEAISRPK